jgi:hypothetical protein
MKNDLKKQIKNIKKNQEQHQLENLNDDLLIHEKKQLLFIQLHIYFYHDLENMFETMFIKNDQILLQKD